MCECQGSSAPIKPSAMSFARKRIMKERYPMKLNLSSKRIGRGSAGKTMKVGKSRKPHSVISSA